MTEQMTPGYTEGIDVRAKVTPEYAEILTSEAMQFVAKLVRAFAGRREELLAIRADRQVELDNGQLPHFLPETEDIRNGDWKIAPLPVDLQDRRFRGRSMYVMRTGAQLTSPVLRGSNIV